MEAVRAVFLFVPLIAAVLPAWSAINCYKPNKTGVETLICTNVRVAAADERMAVAFRDAFLRSRDKEALVQEQDEWRKNVRDACNDVPCLLRAFEQRTSELETYY
jgi:uncharacterized protein